jgi:hypothetical protein
VYQNVHDESGVMWWIHDSLSSESTRVISENQKTSPCGGGGFGDKS